MATTPLPPAAVEERFLRAVEVVTSLPPDGSVQIGNDEKLLFYGMYPGP
jgi:hypothetical protein